MSVTGTCAPRSRWSRTRMLAAKVSLVGGVIAGAWLATATVASASPGIELAEPAEPATVEPSAVNLPASAAEPASADVLDEPVERVEPAAPNVSTTLLEPVRPAEPAPPADPSTPDEQFKPPEPAKPQVGKPDPVSIPEPDMPAFTAPMLVDTTSELLETPPPAPEPPTAPTPREGIGGDPTRAEPEHDSTERGRSTAAPAQQVMHSPPPPPAPVTSQPPGEPAPVQLPPAPTMSAAGAAPGVGAGLKQLVILPATTSELCPGAPALGYRDVFAISDTVAFEPSASPD